MKSLLLLVTARGYLALGVALALASMTALGCAYLANSELTKQLAVKAADDHIRRTKRV